MPSPRPPSAGTWPSRIPSRQAPLVVQRPRWHRGADRGKARQVIVDAQPGKLLLGPDVILRADGGRLVEAAERHLDAVGDDRLMHGERAAAMWAEPALGMRRRTIVQRLAMEPGEGAPREMDEAEHRRAGDPAADAAVADHHPHRRGF